MLNYNEKYMKYYELPVIVSWTISKWTYLRHNKKILLGFQPRALVRAKKQVYEFIQQKVLSTTSLLVNRRMERVQ